MKQKINNLTDDQVSNGTPEDKIIIIKTLFSKEAKLKLQPAKDGSTGRYLGIEVNIPEVEKMKRGYTPEISSSVIIKAEKTFDLNNPQDAIDWNWVKHSKHIAKDFESAQNTGLSEAWFYVYRPGVESRKKLSIMEKEMKLLNKIMDDSETNLYNRVRLLGIDMTGQPLSDVKEYLMTAAKDPNRLESIIKVYESSDISTKLMLYHGLDNDVITFDGFMYKYNNILMGTTENLTLEYLSNPLNVSIVKEIENAIYPKKGIGKEAINTLAKPTKNSKK
ncbi:MAG: hypothetical protein KAH32_04675 [Chlamydiia bacterium]|nr:hypothetical protein [Chlamydiia bacterium]